MWASRSWERPSPPAMPEVSVDGVVYRTNRGETSTRMTLDGTVTEGTTEHVV